MAGYTPAFSFTIVREEATMKNNYEVNGEEVIIHINRKKGEPLTARISLVDLERVDSYPNTWTAYYSPITKSFYVMGYVGAGEKNIKLHSWIMQPDEGMMVDHINHDTLDNTRPNLRVVSPTVNQLNKKTKGYYYNEKTSKWVVRLQVFGKRRVIGTYDTEEEAAQASIKAKEAAILEHM